MSMLSRFATLGGAPTDPYWANVSYLLVGNGANGTTTNIKDSSSNNNATTIFGNTVISTAQSKFGGSSVYFDGTEDYLTVPSSANIGNFGTGDFTIEFWAYANTGAQSSDSVAMFDSRNGGQEGWQIGFHAGAPNTIYIEQNGIKLIANTTFPLQSWNHLSLVRLSGVITLYQNGINVGSVANTSNNTSQITYIGSGYWGPTTRFNGFMYDLRITKGVARYTTNFPPGPTAPFPIG